MYVHRKRHDFIILQKQEYKVTTGHVYGIPDKDKALQ
jgi:hypothetical protein